MSVNDRWDTFVRDSLATLPKDRDGWVDMRDLRAALDDRGTTRPAQDDHLLRMYKAGVIRLAAKGGVSAEDKQAQLIAPDDNGADYQLVRSR